MPRSKTSLVVCPQCKTTPVVRRSSLGTMPRCTTCLALNKAGRLERQAQARKEGRRLSHHDKKGNRYGSTLKLCPYCKKPHRRSHKKIASCARCRPLHLAELKRRKKERSIVYNLQVRLLRFGLSAIQYDKLPKICGICDKTDPGTANGSWHFDHDHRCCKKGCKLCFRGLLCWSCNSSLGKFNDDPDTLIRAAEWIIVGGNFKKLSRKKA